MDEENTSISPARLSYRLTDFAHKMLLECGRGFELGVLLHEFLALGRAEERSDRNLVPSEVKYAQGLDILGNDKAGRVLKDSSQRQHIATYRNVLNLKQIAIYFVVFQGS
jgi:hypothetical protein